MEINRSALWFGNFYRFQQIRQQDYDILLCLSLSPISMVDAEGAMLGG